VVRAVDLRRKRSCVRMSAVPLSDNNPGQVGLASHWPRVTDLSGLSIYGLTA